MADDIDSTVPCYITGKDITKQILPKEMKFLQTSKAILKKIFICYGQEMTLS